jgi:putative ABC transport system permease protein
MISHYIKTAKNNVLNKKSTSLLSLFGLSIAFLSIFYIYSYVSFELSYDSFYKNAHKIYRISGDIVAAENTRTHAIIGPLMGPGLKEEFPEVEDFTRLTPFQHNILLEFEDKSFTVKEAYRVDHSLFDIFSLEFIYGDKKDALVGPDQIVINESLSHIIFGKMNPVGIILMCNEKPYTIKGVIKDSPANAHHKLNVLFSPAEINPDELREVRRSEKFWAPSAYTFIMLKQNSDITAITENFESFFNLHMATFGKRINAKFELVATPLKDLHFSRHMSYDYPKGNELYTYSLIFIALFIFILAMLNYGNMLIFRSVENAKITGIKRTFGASRAIVFWQFLINSFVFITISVVLALIGLFVTLPYSEIITGIEPAKFIDGKEIVQISILLIILSTVSSSVIPFINQFRKQRIQLTNVKPTNETKIRGLKLGKSVVIVQFAISIILIIASIVISKQLNFLIESDMGFDKDNVVLIELPDEESELLKVDAFKDALKTSTLFSNIAFSNRVPGDVMGSIHFQLDVDGETVTKIVNSMSIDYDYIPLMGMKIKKGRNYNRDFKTGARQGVIVNEAFVDYCGFTDDIVGEKVNGIEVIGIIENASFNSLHTEAEPVLFLLNPNPDGYVNIRLKTSKIDEAIRSLKDTWSAFFPDVPFEYQFLDQRVEMLYANDMRKNTLIRLFTLISIIISAMGFLNLATNISKQKTKEIGIRKVNGASSAQIIIMLNKNFLLLVIAAFVIAAPVAYYVMELWLKSFAYKTDISWWVFVLSGFIALFIALATVSFQTFRAARRNPVLSLKYE